ncbi:MAG: DUF222 domain-containing protein [Protaetiibacter sp.]
MTSSTGFLTRVGDTSVPVILPAVGRMRDQELLDAQREVAEVQRRLSAIAAAVAGEIAHRSRRELGHSGLAASRGQRSVEGLISHLTGGSAREARTLVQAGELMPTAAPRPSTAPVAEWLAVIGDAVASAAISVGAAAVVRSRLASTEVARAVAAAGADPGAGAGAGADAMRALTDAARTLVDRAPRLTLEQLIVQAGQARDDLDAAGVATREREQHERRYLRLTPQPDGMVRLTGLLDRESAAIIVPIVDAITNPRRPGPRFAAPDAEPTVDDLVRDARTPEQLMLDSVVELIRIGGRVDDGTVLGDRTPGVRVLVSARDLHTTPNGDGERPGAAYFEGQSEPVSISTAERHICSTGAIPILFDDDTGRVLNLGREQRLFTRTQRIALAARDGGCLMCDRPPSWTEAHHIDHWDEHHGRTDIDDGVLLCRHCHLMVHNRGWRIRREHGAYHLEHPDPDGTLRRTPLPSRSPAAQRLLRATA